MSKRISPFLFYKIITNRAFKKNIKIPKRQTPKWWRWTCIAILPVRDRRHKISEETLTNARDSNLLILGCSLGLWHNPESPEGSGCIPTACDHLHMESSAVQSLHGTTHGSLLGCQPHHWHSPHLKIWEQPCRQRPRCIWPGSPAPESAPENPSRTL